MRFSQRSAGFTQPYWFSDKRWPARGLLAVFVGLNLGIVHIGVLINRWQNDFYIALQDDGDGSNKLAPLASAPACPAVRYHRGNRRLSLHSRYGGCDNGGT